MFLSLEMQEELKGYIDNGYVKATHHPTLPLTIYKYSKEMQYATCFDSNNIYKDSPSDDKWTPLMMMCRGLIIEDGTNKIIAKSFNKFFNFSEYTDGYVEQRMKRIKYSISDKFDGSLIILFEYEGKWITATMGSFESDQVFLANKLLDSYDHRSEALNKDIVYLLEYVGPDNRIVVAYEESDLILLTMLDRDNDFREIDLHSDLNTTDFAYAYNRIIDKEFHFDLKALAKLNKPNSEGYIIKFEDGLRIKVKFEEYVRLHKIVTELSEKQILEFMKENKTSIESFKDVPDELFKWINSVETSFRNLYDSIFKEANEVYDKHCSIKDRKEFALAIKDYKYSHLVFKIADGKFDNLNKSIWKIVEQDRKEKNQNLTYLKKDD